MKFQRSTSYFIVKYAYFLILFLIAYLSYFIFEHPDFQVNKSHYLQKIFAYYAAPFIIPLSVICPVYLWFKYRTLEVNLAEKVIKLNNKFIDISIVKEIYIKYGSITDSYEYTFYEVIPMEYRKLLVIPMFFEPASQVDFEKELNEFCMRNKVKLTSNK
jgi:hypothetical protein